MQPPRGLPQLLTCVRTVPTPSHAVGKGYGPLRTSKMRAPRCVGAINSARHALRASVSCLVSDALSGASKRVISKARLPPHASRFAPVPLSLRISACYNLQSQRLECGSNGPQSCLTRLWSQGETAVDHLSQALAQRLRKESSCVVGRRMPPFSAGPAARLRGRDRSHRPPACGLLRWRRRRLSKDVRLPRG